jgi:hypothetical protein
VPWILEGQTIRVCGGSAAMNRRFRANIKPQIAKRQGKTQEETGLDTGQRHHPGSSDEMPPDNRI